MNQYQACLDSFECIFHKDSNNKTKQLFNCKNCKQIWIIKKKFIEQNQKITHEFDSFVCYGLHSSLEWPLLFWSATCMEKERQSNSQSFLGIPDKLLLSKL